jgi:hypothetical protein
MFELLRLKEEQRDIGTIDSKIQKDIQQEMAKLVKLGSPGHKSAVSSPMQSQGPLSAFERNLVNMWSYLSQLSEVGFSEK